MGEFKVAEEEVAYGAADGIRKKLLKCMFLSYPSYAK
jgi:hypothetical protein